MCSFTMGVASVLWWMSVSITLAVAGPLPKPMARLRCQPSKPARRMGEPSVRFRNSASVHVSRSASWAWSRPWRGLKSSSWVALGARFQGQASWQSSHPNTRLPMSGRSSLAMLPLCSMVR